MFSTNIGFRAKSSKSTGEPDFALASDHASGGVNRIHCPKPLPSLNNERLPAIIRNVSVLAPI